MKVDTYGQKAYDVYAQVRTLVKDKGMPLEEAIREIEGKLYARLPENMVTLIREESYRWE